MAYVDKSYSITSDDGSDFQIGTLSGLPTIPSNATLDSVVLTFTARRSDGATGSSGKVRVVVCGSTIDVVTGMERNKDYSGSKDLTSYVKNNNGTLTYTDGTTSIGVRVYHDYSLLFGTSWWTISNVKIRANYTIPTYTVTVNAGYGGTVSGGGTYEKGTKVNVTATPNVGYKFVGWANQSGVITNTTNPYSFTVTANTTFSAVFEPITYYVAFHGNGATAGSVATQTYKYNENVYLPSCGFTKKLTADWKPNGDDVNIEYTHLEGDCTFRGWSFYNTEDASVYPVGEGFNSLTDKDGETVNIYAQWTKYTFVFPKVSRSGYNFVGWKDDLTGELSQNINSLTTHRSFSYTAQWEKAECTVNFRNQDGTIVKTLSKVTPGSTLGTLPTVSRSGYTFAGWIPCEPAKKTDGTVLDSYEYNGDNAYPLDTKYKNYTNNLSVHIEAYMSNWMDIKNRQIMSCTEGGGWGFGYQANTKVDGAESHGFEVHTGSGYTGYDLKFGTDGVYTNNKWYSFDIVFSNGTIEIFVNGVSKGRRTASGSAIKYHSSNTIFVGAEAATNATTPGGNYFKGYISNVFIANKGTRLAIATTSTVVEGDVDYYPIWRLNTTCTATFKNYDGTVLQTVSVERGETPTYNGSTPTKASTAQYNYTFSGWSPSVGAITGDTTYTAQFTETVRKYTVTASGENGTVTGGGTYEYGKSVTLTAVPNDGYRFKQWSDGVTTATRTVTVTGAATYTAVFELIPPEIKSVQMIYLDKQISATNKVLVKQGFRISINVQ